MGGQLQSEPPKFKAGVALSLALFSYAPENISSQSAQIPSCFMIKLLTHFLIWSLIWVLLFHDINISNIEKVAGRFRHASAYFIVSEFERHLLTKIRKGK